MKKDKIHPRIADDVNSLIARDLIHGIGVRDEATGNTGRWWWREKGPRS
jgi:hypothetical protein